ncbi:plasmid recombination protein [Vibrio harveyi]|uniref:plasmid recombination protein n=1 Tax=Vibrio harveyi TaxID=669 RepID=UPI001EFE70FE|nr:plasmid recombination protein [Vibrio harveyi]MCG9608293.1 plasmid recombination protein [Vibrio harveyi]MCG9666988.1 plasmid recombination protein [Vibrio harveyi]
MNTTILRFEKIKSKTLLNKSSAHVHRFAETPNSNPDKFKFNRILKGSNNDLKDVQRVLDKYKVKPRKNAVICMDALLSLSSEAFKTDKDINLFADKATDFLNARFGNRCSNITLHLDELTPHIHAKIVPLLAKNGGNGGVRLSARDAFGPKQLADLQRDFNAHMSKFFDLVPPKHGAKASHKKVKQFYEEINKDYDKLKEEYKNTLIAKLEEQQNSLVKKYLSRVLPPIDAYCEKQEKILIDQFGYLAKQYADKWREERKKIEIDLNNAFEYNSNDLHFAESAFKKKQKIVDDISKHVNKGAAKKLKVNM